MYTSLAFTVELAYMFASRLIAFWFYETWAKRISPIGVLDQGCFYFCLLLRPKTMFRSYLYKYRLAMS